MSNDFIARWQHRSLLYYLILIYGKNKMVRPQQAFGVRTILGGEYINHLGLIHNTQCSS
jgi:hypothetical protein